jgi:excisionase family DNA binding protein
MKDGLDTTNWPSRLLDIPASDAAGKIVAFVNTPHQRLYKMSAAAKYLGVHEQTLRKLTDEGLIPARLMRRCRVYTLEDLEAYVASLPRWYHHGGERSEASNGDTVND